MSKLFDAMSNGMIVASPTIAAATDETGKRSEPLAADALRKASPVATPSLKRGVAGVRTVSLHLRENQPLLPFAGARRAAGEQYRIVRTKLLHHPRKPRVVLVSSAGPGDGKSITAINLAGVLSLQAEADVLLVDGDLRKPTIHSQLGIQRTPGLAEVVSGASHLQEAIVRTEQFPRLHILPAGDAQVNPSEILDSSSWRTVCGELRTQFEYIVIDSPPIASVADYDLLQQVCDGIVIVARPDHTSRKQCFAAIDVAPKEKLIGVILNCVEDWFLVKPNTYQYEYAV